MSVPDSERESDGGSSSMSQRRQHDERKSAESQNSKSSEVNNSAHTSSRVSGDEKKQDNHNVSVESNRSRYRWMTLALIFLASVIILVTVYSSFPKLEP